MMTDVFDVMHFHYIRK